jgi:hypothetical protein
VTKAGACVPTDIQFCYKPCGPENSGVKSEVCQTSGVYAEMSGCAFDPANDYSCYKLPTDANAACPAGTTPQQNAPCMIDPCIVCNSGAGVSGGGYLDAAGAAKIGFCVCRAPDSTGSKKWSCSSDTAWPCPGNSGC